MPQADQDRPREEQDGDLIWARDDVVITAGPNRDTVLTYYVKVVGTEEIFELGEVEYVVWRQFEGGRSIEAAERAAVQRLGDQFRARFRGLAAELAMRGLLQGAVPDSLIAAFSADPRARQVRLQYQVDPVERDPDWPFYRFSLFDPNRLFGVLARWFGFFRHAAWPIGFAAFLGGLVLIKHSAELHADFPPTVLTAYGIPHLLVMLLTVKLLRAVVMATTVRYYGARIRFFSLDLLFGFWPRIRVDRRGLLQLKRTPQLWAHSARTFAQLAFFGFGALGWWWFRGDGTIKSALSLVICQAGVIELIISALPFLGGGKTEIYYWFCAYFEEPFLRERAQAALRGVFSRQAGALDLEPLERSALIAYGLSMVASIVLVSYFVINLLMAWTGQFRGSGFGLFLVLCVMFGLWFVTRRSRRQRKEAAHLERRERRRSARRRRGTPQFAPLTEK